MAEPGTDSSPSAADPPTIDMFDVEHEIGRGGFAIVHKATERSSGLPVALKQIGKRKLEKQGLLACARNEAEIQLRCDHPNIVKVNDFFEDRDSIWLSLELCEEGSVLQLLQEEKLLSEHHAALYLRQLLRAIAYLHRNGVMHRDIKLSNLSLQRINMRMLRQRN